MPTWEVSDIFAGGYWEKLRIATTPADIANQGNI
jgi:hypothetical protein